MNQHNLLPSHRIAAKRQRRAVRRWVFINSAYAVLLLIAGLSYAFSPSSASAVALPAAATADVAQLNTKLAVLRQQAKTLNENLRSTLEVTDTPDWSYLLAGLARSLGDDVVLSGVEGSPGASRPTDTTPQRFTLAGIGRSHAAVSAFILRVESLRLFSNVALTQTTIQPQHGDQSVGFRLICTLPNGEK